MSPLIAVGLAITMRLFEAQFAVSGAACSLGKPDASGRRTTYWEIQGITEVCVDVPVTTQSPARATLAILLVYRGNIASGLPESILALAKTNTTLGLANPRFELQLDRQTLSLMTSGRQYQLVFPCNTATSQCPFDGVVASLSPSELLALSTSDSVQGHALGAEFVVSPQGIQAIRTAATLGAR